eukprot:4383443-Amphidinium_carterae.1
MLLESRCADCNLKSKNYRTAKGEAADAAQTRAETLFQTLTNQENLLLVHRRPRDKRLKPS